MDDKFIEIRDLRFADLAEGTDADGLELILPWLPHGKGIVARLHNRQAGSAQFDYVLITEDMVYFAILNDHHPFTPDSSTLGLRSIKAFKGCDMTAFAFFVEPFDTLEAEDFPQIRLMLKEGKRILLKLDSAAVTEGTMARLQELATKNFFIG